MKDEYYFYMQELKEILSAMRWSPSIIKKAPPPPSEICLQILNIFRLPSTNVKETTPRWRKNSPPWRDFDFSSSQKPRHITPIVIHDCEARKWKHLDYDKWNISFSRVSTTRKWKIKIRISIMVGLWTRVNAPRLPLLLLLLLPHA